MPYGDRTGPMGQGPMTGRALGYCAGFDAPGNTKRAGRGMGRGCGYGKGFGRGRGSHPGWGYGRSFYGAWPHSGNYPVAPWMMPADKEEELILLKAQAKALKRNQNEIEKRLRELENEKDDE